MWYITLISNAFTINPSHLNICDAELENNTGKHLTDNLSAMGDKNNNNITNNTTIFLIIRNVVIIKFLVTILVDRIRPPCLSSLFILSKFFMSKRTFGLSVI